LKNLRFVSATGSTNQMSDGQGHRITSDVEKGVTSVSKAIGGHRCCNLSKQCRVEVHLVEQNESSA
jgi:hypothetical protein